MVCTLQFITVITTLYICVSPPPPPPQDIGVVQKGGEGNSVTKNNGPASLSIGTDQEKKTETREPDQRKQKQALLELWGNVFKIKKEKC